MTPMARVDARLFRAVPAYRIASYRVLLGATTLCFHLPATETWLDRYVATSFHVPMIGGVPGLTTAAAAVLGGARWAAGLGLLVGAVPRVAAGFLALTGAWIFVLDVRHYSHHFQFHVLMLALIACSADGLSLRRLAAEDDGRAVTVAWPEQMLRAQLAIVFFFAAIDKAFSPDWGLAGRRVAALATKRHGPPLAWARSVNRLVMELGAPVFSAATIATELAIAATALVQRLWPIMVAVTFAFALYLEFTVDQGYFAWDVLAALVLFLPAADRAHAVPVASDCPRCRRRRRILAAMDWLRRLRFSDGMRDTSGSTTTTASPRAEHRRHHRLLLRDPEGRAHTGIAAVRRLVLLLAPAIWLAFTVLRSGAGVLDPAVGADAALLAIAGCLALWTPGLVRRASPACGRVAR